MITNIEDLRRFSIHDLKRLGMLRDSFNGSMNWTQNGEKVASIGLRVRLSGEEPAVLLHYTLTDTKEVVADWVRLHYQPSNLPGHTGGYWMFICPEKDKPCRVLFLHDGHFKSRQALPPGTLYKCQTTTAYFRNIGRIFDCEEMKTALNDTLRKPYGKMFYRGKPTRKTRRLMEIKDRNEKVVFQWLRAQNKGDN